uniref:Uncharacterized protein n=1 Tax=Romanomermis culicivorax TaxID=13658 RepID=A0A915HGQ9_ROMCU
MYFFLPLCKQHKKYPDIRSGLILLVHQNIYTHLSFMPLLHWICSYHQALLLIKSEFLQKSCRNPLKKQDHNRSRGLQLIDISTADKLHALTGTL